jgi:hypothetical protein
MKIFILLLLSMSVFAQSQSPLEPNGVSYGTNFLPSGSMVSLSDTTTAAAFQIDGPTGEMLVRISLKDGKATFGKNYTPDAAGKAFWDAIANRYPCAAPKESKKP